MWSRLSTPRVSHIALSLRDGAPGSGVCGTRAERDAPLAYGPANKAQGAP